MTEPRNHTVRLLQEIRGAIAALDNKLESKVEMLDKKIDRNHEEVKERIEIVRQGAFGESVLGRYATAGIDQRIAAAEKRISDLEQQRR